MFFWNLGQNLNAWVFFESGVDEFQLLSNCANALLHEE